MSNPISKWFKLPTMAERLRAQGVRDDVVQAAERTAFGRQSDRGIPAMAALLSDDEGVIKLVEARHDSATGLLVLTTRRLLFAPSALDRKSETVVPLADVLSVADRRHRGMGVLEITTPAGSFVADQILGNQAEVLSLAVQQAKNPPPDGPSRRRDPLDELAELRALHQAGAIGDAEFQARKQHLFGQI
jgi:hypothetical protein